MSSTFLEFEKPIAEIEAKLEELQYITDESDEGLSLEVTRLKSKSQAITKNIYNSSKCFCNAYALHKNTKGSILRMGLFGYKMPCRTVDIDYGY